jgi:hypothetical protein
VINKNDDNFKLDDVELFILPEAQAAGSNLECSFVPSPGLGISKKIVALPLPEFFRVHTYESNFSGTRLGYQFANKLPPIMMKVFSLNQNWGKARS